MNFYETQMGRNFFEVQLPRLIQVLEFYYGNLEIGACSGETCSNHHLKEIISIQDELQAQLTPEQWALFRKCITLIEDQSLDEASYMFQHGYRLAVNLIVAGLKETKEKNKDGETI